MAKTTAYTDFLTRANGAGNSPFVTPPPPVPVSQPLPGQVKNAAGGYTFRVTDEVLMERMLGLGTENDTIYQKASVLTADAAQATIRTIKKYGPAAVDLIRAWSVPGRAVRVSPQLFALALASSAKYASPETRTYAFESLPLVARTMSHLLEFVSYAATSRGWGRGLTGAIERWLNGMSDEKFAYQAIKYRARSGWSVGDLLRSVHPKAGTADRDGLYAYVLNGLESEKVTRLVARGGEGPWRVVEGYERAKSAKTERDIVALIETYKLTWEMVPSQWLSKHTVWTALLPHIQIGALVRSLGRLSSLDMTKPGSAVADFIATRLTDVMAVKRAGVHPIKTFADFKRYASGHGDKGSLVWTPNRKVMDALTETIYLSFPNIEPLGNKIVLGLDLSGSMAGNFVNGIEGVPAYEGAALMALAVARVEPNAVIMGYDDRAHDLNITPTMRLDEVVRLLQRTGGDGTACHLPIDWAKSNGVRADSIWNFTDSDDWAGKQHAADAIVAYRKWADLPTRMVVCEMVANQSSIGNPKDALTGRVIGLDGNIMHTVRAFVETRQGEKVSRSQLATASADDDLSDD